MFYDICTVNSAWSHGSFFLMLDAVSMHVTLKECPQNRKALQCYEIILKEYIAKFGYPIAFCCDNAKNLSNELAADLAHILNIKHFKITPGRSQTNKSELVNRYILAALRSCSQSNKLTEENFSVYLQLAAFSWNVSTMASTGLSPAQIFFNSGNLRHNQFISFSNLIHQQSRNVLSLQLQRVLVVLEEIRKRKKKADLIKKKKVGYLQR